MFDSSIIETLKFVFMATLPYILQFGILAIILMLILKLMKKMKSRQLKNIDKEFYYREIPCYNDINMAYFLLYNYSNINKNELNNGLLGAYLLKWYQNGYVGINSYSTKDNDYAIDLKDGNWEKNKVESLIYEFLKRVSGNNNTLEKKEIKNYCSVNGKYILTNLFKRIIENIQKDLETQGYITVEPPKNYIFFKTQPKIILSNEIINEYQNLIGLKNFLSDFSLIEEKRHLEIPLWEDYLIFANLLCVADKVKSQFKKIYPDFNDIKSMFEISFDNTLEGRVENLYKMLKIRILIVVGILIFCLIVIFGIASGIKISDKLMPIVGIGMIAFITFILLRKYNVNKKVKEMNIKTYGKITDVQVHKTEEWDHDLKKYTTNTSYSFTYCYEVNNVTYKGHSRSNVFKRNGQRIKIYYNDMKPEISETAEKHNYYLRAAITLLILFSIVAILGIFMYK